jgi:hypothetical protein
MTSEENQVYQVAHAIPVLIEIPGQIRENGAVHFWENFTLFPAGIQRCFWISGVGEGEIRGNHAHWKETQVIIALAGKLSVQVEGIQGDCGQFELHSPGVGLLVPPLNWVEVTFCTGSVLLGLSDRAFSEQDYIRDKKYFGSLQKRNS